MPAKRAALHAHHEHHEKGKAQTPAVDPNAPAIDSSLPPGGVPTPINPPPPGKGEGKGKGKGGKK